MVPGDRRSGRARGSWGFRARDARRFSWGCRPIRRRGRRWRLRGWARTDSSGRCAFDTIRPAGYPDSDDPQHVHMHIIEVGRCTYYIDEIAFEDDPRPKPQHRQHHRGRGGSGIVAPRRDEAGVWHVTRDIVLGAGIPGYGEVGN